MECNRSVIFNPLWREGFRPFLLGLMRGDRSQQRIPTTGRSVVRRGVLKGMASPLVRWIAMLALLASVLPQLAAGLLMLKDYRGEHELRCHFGVRSIEVTMHHLNADTLSGESALVHRQPSLRTLVFGRCHSNNDRDHHFVFGRHYVLIEDDNSRTQEVASLVAFEPAACDAIIFDPGLSESSYVSRCLESMGGSLPPQWMRRGVMMQL
jgi:hypothetical protein